MTDTTYTVIEDPDEIARIKADAGSNGYLDALAAGKMIHMSDIPRIGGGIKRRTGKYARLRSLPAPQGGFYLWIEFIEEREAEA